MGTRTNRAVELTTVCLMMLCCFPRPPLPVSNQQKPNHLPPSTPDVINEQHLNLAEKFVKSFTLLSIRESKIKNQGLLDTS